MSTEAFLVASIGVIAAVILLLLSNDPLAALVLAAFWSALAFGRWELNR